MDNKSLSSNQIIPPSQMVENDKKIINEVNEDLCKTCASNTCEACISDCLFIDGPIIKCSSYKKYQIGSDPIE
jgi:hypothetical protein